MVVLRSRVVRLCLGVVALIVAYQVGATRTSAPIQPTSPGLATAVQDTETVDLGQQLWGETVPFALEFTNQERETLVVGSIRSSCGCTVLNDEAGLVGRAVAPGETIVMHGHVDTQLTAGARVHTVTLRLSSGRTLHWKLKIDVIGTWQVTPPSLDFGTVIVDASGAAPAEELVFESSSDRLLCVAANVPWLDCRVSEDDTRALVLVRLLPERLPVGLQSADVTIRTSSARKPSGVVCVRARGVWELTPTPEHVLLSDTERVRVGFVTSDGQRARICEAYASVSSVLVTVLESGDIDVGAEQPVVRHATAVVRVRDYAGRSGAVQVSVFE